MISRLQKLKNPENKSAKTAINFMDDKDFGIGAQILHDLDIYDLKLLSNSSIIKKSGYDRLRFKH